MKEFNIRYYFILDLYAAYCRYDITTFSTVKEITFNQYREIRLIFSKQIVFVLITLKMINFI